MRALVLAVLVTGAVLVFAPSVFASGPTSLARTGWQVTRPYGPVVTAHFAAHGDPGFYNYIPGPIPGENAAGWSNCGPANFLCKNADTIAMNMPNGSRLSGFPCLGSADFTFFQSLVSIPEGTQITQFGVSMSGADDGARVSIYNSTYPNGFIFSGSYIALSGGTGSTTDLSPYMVAGEVNRVVITQMDDCATGNNLQFAQILLNGTVVPPAPTDTAAPTDAPAVSPAANGAGWRNSDATVNWNWTDSGSGIDSSNCTQSSASSGEGTITLSSTCKDLAGNSASDSITVNVDKSAPTDSPAVSPAANGAGWRNSDATVNWNWTDSGSGIDSSNCTQSSASSGEGTITLSSTCKDLAGNSASDSVTVNVDKTAPVVAYSGNAGTYSVDQSVSISCSASDTLSGLASNTCTNVSGSAWSFGLGTHTVSANATDKAGNTGSNSASFTVTVDATSLCALVQQFTTNHGIANSLCVKLQAAAGAAARGQTKTKNNNLNAFDNEVQAQSGKAFTAAQATLLVEFAAAL